ncbi:hypothetical protein JUN65_06135 [Gluconacetobacter azotocaptans]|uniref:hypothetical protein n=1 Tax=Gluconacetobacter azotocaptans TaxID=142834 RepID=UPI00195EFC98|nr:hypothetical protein [Gluconacetobacter azotocaptans]MBM9401160.1 hypothetical protein [Gluconacetobacter azotocaptans]
MTDDNQTTKSELAFGQIWRTTIPGNSENARQIVSHPTDGRVSFILRSPPGPVIGRSPTEIRIGLSEWWEWVKAHKAEIIELQDMENPPGQEPHHA